ncbi:uncharacterized protein [Physcomitrium patens]|uniref:uncharacterized protein isoform X2 n=1 Tax=Physcomitrium patens TaxID=3218 RepID=UPI003CCD2EC6
MSRLQAPFIDFYPKVILFSRVQCSLSFAHCSKSELCGFDACCAVLIICFLMAFTQFRAPGCSAEISEQMRLDRDFCL